ncbi:putative membrane protein [Escherichia coli 2-316-03_S4_C2]|nr:putative membrane protein [Escherichia coli 2-316-03_S4_C2]
MLKKHPLCGAFLVFWGFKFLSMNKIVFYCRWQIFLKNPAL